MGHKRERMVSRARPVYPSDRTRAGQPGGVGLVPQNEPASRERAAREGGASGTDGVTR